VYTRRAIVIREVTIKSSVSRPSSSFLWQTTSPEGNIYHDAVTIEFNDNLAGPYNVGSNSRIWDGEIRKYCPRRFMAERVYVRTTVDVNIIFNDPEGTKIFIPANTERYFNCKVIKVYVQRGGDSDGKLYMSFEGNIVL
jgi:hypothetical protein